MRERHDHAKEAMDAIDERLAAPPPTIEEAIHHAIEVHWMTEQEGEECLHAYTEAFLKSSRQ